MRNYKEDLWTAKICDRLKKELDANKYEVVCKERVPYSISIKEDMHITFRGYEVDLLIKEKRGENFIPKLIIESKYNKITTHDAITYSNKALGHKSLYDGLRYGLMIGNSKEKGVSPRVVKHGINFDFMFVFSSDIPTKKEWSLFVDVIKRNLIIADKLESIISEKKKKSKKRYYCIEKNIAFYE